MYIAILEYLFIKNDRHRRPKLDPSPPPEIPDPLPAVEAGRKYRRGGAPLAGYDVTQAFLCGKDT